MAKTATFKVGDTVLYNHSEYEISEIINGQNGKWVLLKNRLGYVQQTELKKASKR